MRRGLKRIWAVAGKDLLETRRDKLAPIFTIVMPLAFTAFFGLLFAGGNQKLPLYVVDLDRGDAAKQVVAALQKSDVVKVTVVAQDEAEKAVDQKKAAAAVIVPTGFSEAVARGDASNLTFVQQSGSSGAQTAQEEVRAVLADLVVQEQAAQAAAAASGAPLAAARRAAAAALDKPVAGVKVVEAGAESGEAPSGFVLSSPGMIIQFILFGLSGAAGAFIIERRSGTLRRLFTTRLRGRELLAGKMLGMFLLTYAQSWLMILFGQLVFNVDYFRDPAALVLVVTALCLMVSSVGLLLATAFSSDQALVSASVLISMGISALSGAWFPLEVTGPAFSAVGHTLPTAWVLDALRGIVVRGWDVRDVLPAVGYTMAWAVGLFLLGVWRFRGVARAD